jgi:hypothetical protein
MSRKIDASDFLDENGKIAFKPISKKNLYLPPITSVLSDLGFKANLQKLVEYAGNEAGKPIPISPSSITNISTKGISVKSAKKVVMWFTGIIPKPIKAAIIKRSLSFKSLRIAITGSTSSEWLPFISGMEATMPKDDVSELFVPLFNFLKSRSEAESSHLRSARHDIKYKKIDVNDFKIVWKRYIDIWAQYSQVPADQLDSITHIIGNTSNRSDISAKDQELAALPLIYLRYDFYLEIIAHYEVTLLLFFDKHIKEIPDLKSKKWLLTKAIEKYSIGSDLTNTNTPRTLFGALLEVLKDELSTIATKEKTNSNDGWLKLAGFIDIKTKDSLEPLNQRQYEQLKQWRKGKDTPSFKSLNKFISNYLDHVGRSGGEDIEICFRIMMMLDKLEKRVLATVDDKSAAKLQIKKVLAQYPTYYQACLNREIKKAEPQ